LKEGKLPPRDAVRTEGLVNYFPYRYPLTGAAARAAVDAPFATSIEVAAAPWNPAHRLVRIGIKGRDVAEAERPPVNLVFLVDVCNAMNEPSKLPLVKESLRMLLEKLKPTDRIAIVTYTNGSGLTLPSTPAEKKREILDSLDHLAARGVTNGAMGLQLAYDVAKANLLHDGFNRVILCTDGDFNLGFVNSESVIKRVQAETKRGVYLTVLGFGIDRFKDSLLDRLADEGQGNYGYVENEMEAKKLLVDRMSGALQTIAHEVKLQVEFNPALASAYRLIGYENTGSGDDASTAQNTDSGEMTAGDTVTALYEVIPVQNQNAKASLKNEPTAARPGADKGRVASNKSAENESMGTASTGELLTLKVHFRPPTVTISRKLEVPLLDAGAMFASASQDFKFAAAVAGFGMILSESPHRGNATYDRVLAWAEDGRGDDETGYRREFIDLVKKAKVLSTE